MDALEPQPGERALDIGDAMAPAVVPSSFDVVASLVLFFLPDPLEALRAWRELLVDATLASFRPPETADARTTAAKGPFASDEGMDSC